jgi:hypothetical protein
MTRYVAKNAVAAGLADRCLLQVAYAIGKGPSHVPHGRYVRDRTGRPGEARGGASGTSSTSGRRRHPGPDLRRPIYLETAAYGHRKEFPWKRDHRARGLRRLKRRRPGRICTGRILALDRPFTYERRPAGAGLIVRSVRARKLTKGCAGRYE